MSQFIVSVDLKDLSEGFSEYCAAHGLDRKARADFMRQAIAAAIKADLEAQKPPPAIPEGKRKWLRISMTDENYERLVEAARLSRATSISEYVARVAEVAAPMSNSRRSAVRRGLPPETLERIGRSNVYLLGIGRNLNQIARSLHIAPGQTTDKDRADIRSIRRTIQSHVDFVNTSLSTLMPTGKLRGQKRK